MNKTARFELVLEPDLKEELVKAFGKGHLGDLARRLLIKELRKHKNKTMKQEIYDQVLAEGTALERSKAQKAYDSANKE